MHGERDGGTLEWEVEWSYKCQKALKERKSVAPAEHLTAIPCLSSA